MTFSLWPQDTIAWRFGVTIVAAMAVACVLIGLFFALGGVWARPPMNAEDRLEGATAIIRIIEASPLQMRQTLAEAAVTKNYRLDWHAASSSVSTLLNAANDDRNLVTRSKEFRTFANDIQRTIRLFITTDAPIAVSTDFAFFSLQSSKYPHGYFIAVKLKDESWLVFTVFDRNWGLSQSQRLAIWGTFLILSFAIVSAVAARQLSRPIRQFAAAVRISGINTQSPPITERGPQELKEVIAAFNIMRTQLQELVAYRTAMLAAISHDLRTPLTRMRLRGEFIENATQQARLFRDVDEMRAMIDGALAFFRGDADEEATRTFDLSGILQSIVDDYADQGIKIGYAGPDRAVYLGRPIALKRAFTNLIENAVKYGTPPEIELSCGATIVTVTIRDHGPGIPPDALLLVFNPFYRLDRSRNRVTGGVGLGLTAAQAIIRGHGGDIVLQNQPAGGLEATVTLPGVTTHQSW
ncbi:ATP-binding protein [Telmatospirillum sp.]|uniref:sensor histidine kinase n=1 Tax=Telmatospirillum sp. TaxID=2079197 RepID=UPI00283FE8B7|nr:ATP-binding protein [Telmatospirillum sp.]MDR3441167.1 ATP-binding protein [Telmatospirillum sp.]